MSKIRDDPELSNPPPKGKCAKSGSTPGDMVVELDKLLKLAGPMLFVSFLQFSLQMISVIMVGRLGEIHLASASLTTSLSGVTGYTLMIGMGGALETLCGQAYGAKQYKMVGIHAQRGMLVLAILSVPISVLWGFTGPVLKILKQDRAISQMAGQSAPWLIPSILPFAILQCQTKFLQTQSITHPQMAGTALGCLVHGLSCWVLIYRFRMGNSGACLANGVTYWAIVIVLAGYIKFSSPCQDTWKGFSFKSARGLASFLKLGVPSALMMCLNTSAAVFRIPMSLGSAVSTRVSNELGAGNAKAARLAVRVVLLLAVSQGILGSSIATAARHVWGCIYTNDPILIRYLAAVAPKIAVSNFIDGIDAVLSGCIRGCGWQKRGAFISLGAYYLVGIPVAAFLTFFLNYGGEGFLLGIIAGSSVKAILLLIITMGINWDHEVSR
ncbi:Protein DETOXIFICATION 16 [Linum grandiflorum]